MIDKDKQMEQYHSEQNKIFETYLDDRFFSEWRRKDGSDRRVSSLELILFPKCNYKCTYCYITNHGDEIYPPIPDEKPEDVLENLDKVLNWIIENEFRLPSMDLFSAEFFVQPQWSQVFDRIIAAVKRSYAFTRSICIPTNMSFVMNDETTGKVKMYHKKFKELGILLHLSGSVEGLHCDNLTRPGAIKYNEEFYKRVFEFFAEIGGGFHPMVAADNIEAWKDNYRWWIDMYKKYGIGKICRNPKRRDEGERFRTGTPFLLEVRNNNWTPEKIKVYEEFLEYEFETLLNDVYEGDLEWLAVTLLKLNSETISKATQNTMLEIVPEGRLTCSIQHQMFIRVRYMDIVPCHRTCYDKYQYGSFIQKDEKIVGYKANNIPLMMKILEMNPIYSMPKCSSCRYSVVCMGQCLGAMQENCGDLFVPADTVCKMIRAKYNKVAELYKKYGIFDAARNYFRKNEPDRQDIFNEINRREDLICMITRK